MVSVAVCMFGLLALSHYGECGTIGWTLPASGSAATTNAMAEGTAAPTAIDTVVATSTKAAPVAFTYSLLAPASSVITLTTAALTNTIVLDYETQSTLLIIVQAEDDDSPAGTGTGTLTLSITAVATDPSFASLVNCVVVSDMTAASQTITTLAATDPDGDTLTYSIAAAGNTNTDFAISSAGVVTSANILYGTVTRRYTMTVYAADASLSGTTILNVCVGSSTYCTPCSSSSGGVALKAISIMTILAAFLVDRLQ